jgi:putative MFS transporter
LAGYILLPAGAWRWMFVIPGVACLVLWLVARRIPESPRWLEAVGRSAQAERTMEEIEREVATSLHAVLPPVGAVHASRSAEAEMTDNLWRKPWLQRLLLAICIALGANAAISTVLTWLPTILLTQGLTLSNTLQRNLLMTAGTPIGALLGALFADRLGRRRGIASIAVIAAALAALFSVSSSGGLSIALGFTLLTALAFLANVVYAVYLPELFPTTLRVQGAAAAAAATKFAFIFLPFAMASLLSQGGTVAAMGLIEGCLFLVAVSTLLFGAETAYKPLEVASGGLAQRGSRSELAH